MGLLSGDEEEINSLLGDIEILKEALQCYTDRSNWLTESDEGGYVNRIEWNASGDLWRVPWKRAEQALARIV